MAKMAGLHAELSELPDMCEYCGDTTEVCEDAGECPAGLR